MRRFLTAALLIATASFAATPARAADRLIVVFPLRSSPELAPKADAVTRELLDQIGALDGYYARIVPMPTKGTMGDAAGKVGADTYVAGDLNEKPDGLEIRVDAYASNGDTSTGEYFAKLTNHDSLPDRPGAGLLFGDATATIRPRAVVHRNAILVPSGLPVLVSVETPVSSALAKTGDTFTFQSAAPVVIGDYVVIRKGAEGRGVVTVVERARGNGHPGRLGLRFDSIAGVDGSRIALCNALKREDGEEKSGAASTLTIASYLALGPVGLFAHDFMRGKDITIDDATVVKVYVDHAMQAAFAR